MQPVPLSELRRALMPLMHERTPSEAQLTRLIASGLVPSVRLHARKGSGAPSISPDPLYDPLRVVTALAAADLSSGLAPTGSWPDDTADDTESALNARNAALSGERPGVSTSPRAHGLSGLPLTDIAARLAALLGSAAPSLSTLRNWERAGLIAPVRELPAGQRRRRYYDFEAVQAVVTGRAEGGRQAEKSDGDTAEGLALVSLEGADKLVSLLKASELLRGLLGPGAPVYLTLRRWETAGRIKPEGIRPSGRKLYRLDALLSLVRSGQGAIQDGAVKPQQPSGITPESTDASRDPAASESTHDGEDAGQPRVPSAIGQLEQRVAQLVELLSGFSGLMSTNGPIDAIGTIGNVGLQLAGFLDMAQTLNASLEAVLGKLDTQGALPRGPVPESVMPDAALTGLTASIQNVLQTFEGLKKTVLLRQDSEIQLLRERVRELEVRARESQSQFVGRSGTRY